MTFGCGSGCITGMADHEVYPNSPTLADPNIAARLAGHLASRARDLVKKPPEELLHRLTVEFGMSWSGIASAVGISGQGIREWRLGSSISTENKLALARVVAALDMLMEAKIEDPASWLELPILDGYGPCRLDLLSGKQYGSLFDLAYSYRAPQEVLHTLDPNWETEFRLEHEVFIAEDGLPAIRRRKSA